MKHLLLLSLFFVIPAGVYAMSQLKECPQSPNCVSTQTRQQDKRMPSLQYPGSLEDAKNKIKSIVASLPRTELVKEEEFYMQFTFKSRIFRFVDEVEFLFDPANKQIHYRSASRSGYFDLGVNRKRMEKITRLYLK